MRGVGEITDIYLWKTIHDVLPTAGTKVCKQIYDVLHAKPSWRISDIEALYY